MQPQAKDHKDSKSGCSVQPDWIALSQACCLPLRRERAAKSKAAAPHWKACYPEQRLFGRRDDKDDAAYKKDQSEDTQ